VFAGMDDILKIATGISTPLMLAGFIAASLLLIARQIIKSNLFTQVSQTASGNLIKHLIDRFFVLAILSMVLGFSGYVIEFFKPDALLKSASGVVFDSPNFSSLKLSFEDGDAWDIAPFPDKKNVILRLKAVPASKDKSIPISLKAKLFIKTNSGQEEYKVDTSLDENGIPPTIITRFGIDSLIPKDRFDSYMKNPKEAKAQIKIQYDNDIVPTDLWFSTEWFDFNSQTIRVSK
jgi:hypothetical protein